MSGFIAVSVSLIGLSGVLFTLAIFIQMILSFPAMLSSNSQSYVQQQRKAYTISAAPVPEELELDEELEYDEPETELDEVHDDSVERWIDVVDEAMNNISSVKSASTTQISQQRRKSIVGATRAKPITRGRARRRRSRAGTTTRPGLRSKTTSWRRYEQSDCEFETENAYDTENMPFHERQHCNPAWRNTLAR